MSLKTFDFSQFRKAQDIDAKINLSPILCMVTILSMFFLFNSRFVLSPGIDITLPVSDYAVASDSIGFLTVKINKSPSNADETQLMLQNCYYDSIIKSY